MAAIAESLRRNPDAVSTKPRFLFFALAGLIVAVLYAVHLSYCQNSTLQYLDGIFINSDMHTSLVWAKGIREQGWLNPHPYHPWNTLLQSIAPYPQWVQWWGGEQVFQQSPLYTYLLSAMMKILLLMRIFQAMMSIAACALIGLFTARISGRIAGWIAFWLAALYAPFYAYTWPFLRDGLGWFLAAALLWALAELTHAEWSSARARRVRLFVGVLLGLGFLAKETYLLLIPIVWAALTGVAWKRQQWGIALRVGIATVLSISPLVARNYCVKAPLLSSSSRFAETFVWGNSPGTQPTVSVFVPEGTRRILYATGARTLPVIVEPIASYSDGVRGGLKLQGRKLLTLFDPYELPDNLSIYFVASISPVVRLGLRYWMILAPALAVVVVCVV